MKKIVAVLFFTLLFPSAMYAQQKGDKFIGGSVGLVAGTDYEASYGVSLEGGAFVIDNLKIYANIAYQGTSGVNAFMLGPGVSYYVKLAEKLYYTPSFEIGLATDFSSLGVGLDLNLFGMEFRPTKHFSVGVNLCNLSYAAIDGYESFAFNIGSAVFLSYYF